MPELPEVETIRRGLKSVILNKRIIDFETRDSKIIQIKKEDIVGSKITSIDRRAKILIINLDNKKSLLVHLKMTGQMIWEKVVGMDDYKLRNKKSNRVSGGHPSIDWVAKLPNVHTRAIFYFEDKSALFFNDLRRFGYIKMYSTDGLAEEKELKQLGPEPFDEKTGSSSKEFSVDYLIRRASKVPSRKIKQFITDQEIIAGVGNIYVDEALFLAGIMPTRRVDQISLEEWRKIREAIIDVLELGIKYGGSSEDTYVDAFGEQGEMNQHVKVYRRTGQPCLNGCGGRIERIVVGGRGTHFCPNCQK